MPGSERRDSGAQASLSHHLATFLKASFFDYVLVLVVSSALVFTVSYGFNSAAALRGNIFVIAVVCALVLAALYVGSWSKRAIPVSLALYAAVAAGAVVFVSGLSPAPTDLFVDGQVNDVDGNYAVFGIVLVAVPPLVYVLSRRTWGVAVLLFLTALACGTIQFLYRDWMSAEPGTAAAVVAYLGVGALFFVQGYRQGVMKSHIVKKTSFFGSFAYGVIGAGLCLLVGAGVFFGVIAGLGITTVDAKPFEDYYSRPIEEYDGTYQQQQVYDPNLGTSTLSDEVDTTQDDESGAEGELDEDSGGGFTFVSAVVDTLNLDEWQDAFEAVAFDMPLSLRILLWLVPFLAIALVVYLRYHQRARRLKKIEAHPYPVRVVLLYNYFMKGFKRLKVEKPPALTPLEFALSSSNELAGFARNDSHADLLGITLIYQRAVYGAGNVSEQDYRYVKDYYQAFFKNAHARMGHPRWLFNGFWRI